METYLFIGYAQMMEILEFQVGSDTEINPPFTRDCLRG